MVGKKHSWKANQSTLASGGSEHAYLFSVAISWGNEMNFSLSANMLGFCSDSHIYYTCIATDFMDPQKLLNFICIQMYI